jgi:DNA-directed RNA polymerase specialized sigma24 family protein
MGKLSGTVDADAHDNLAANGAAVAKLPARQRAAVVLRNFGDLPDVAIARALRCQPGTVRSLVHRALTELREVIEL